MKNYFLILALCCAVAFVGCKKEEVESIPQIPEDMEEAFPDPIFREYVLTNFDTNGDGKISGKDALAVTKIDVYDRGINKGIKSLEGLQYFTNLTVLDCRCNQLTALDVSKNTQLTELYCSANQLPALDVSKNTQLTELYCSANQLTALDVSKNTQLKIFPCYNNQLTSLDVSNNKQLIFLNCEHNQLTTLDVSKTNIGKGGNITTKTGETTEYPLYCASMETLQTLYLKNGWSIKGVTEDNGRSTDYIPEQTKIVFVD